MAAFSEERAPSCLIGLWGLSVIVETQGSHEEAVRGARREGESEPIRCERPLCQSHASCERILLVKRAGLAAVAFRDACDQLITSFIILLPLVQNTLKNPCACLSPVERCLLYFHLFRLCLAGCHNWRAALNYTGWNPASSSKTGRASCALQREGIIDEFLSSILFRPFRRPDTIS